MKDDSLDDRLDALVARYSDELETGKSPERRKYLEELPPELRPGLERCLKMIEAGSASTPSAARPLASGLQLDQYELTRELGRGGMAIVWLAKDSALSRSVALKILRPGLALEEKHASRFRREATAIASLRHPNVVQIFGTGEAHGYHYLAMEFVEGPSLATVLEALPRDRARTAADLARATGDPSIGLTSQSYEQALAALLSPVAGALASAHEEGLVHRDIKPSNILLHRDGRAILADFGLAKGDEDPALSLTGDPLGTPYYMSPEQAYVTGVGRIDHRTDIYSFGVTLFEALTGERPFRGQSFLEVIEAIRSTIPPSVRALAPGCSRNASALVARAMQRERDDRYPTARALHEDLVALSAGRPTVALSETGSAWRRAWLQFRLMTSGVPYEYRSPRTFLGLPLVHIVTGRRLRGQPLRVAKGWLAVGDIAYGGIASGAVACGGIAFGAIAAGVLTWSAIGLGLFAFAGIAVGGATMGGLSVGGLAFGGVAYGYAAIGGVARGHYAVGGNASGTHVISGDVEDPEAVHFFEETLPSFFQLDWLF